MSRTDSRAKITHTPEGRDDGETGRQFVLPRIVVLSFLATLASTLIVWLYPRNAPAPLPLAWIAAQAFALTIPGFVVAGLLKSRLPTLALIAGAALLLAIPVLMLFDAIVFHWIGDRLLSAAIWRIATDLRIALLGHVTFRMLLSAAALLIACSTCVALMLLSAQWIAHQWRRRTHLPGPMIAYAALLLIAGVAAVPALARFPETRRKMARQSSCHPLCVVGLIPFRDAGKQMPNLADAKLPDDNGVADSLNVAVQARDHRLRRLGIKGGVPDRNSLPDVLVVVVESFRRELVDPEVMPNLWKLAAKGIHCRKHFSGGNATNHGMFGLINGLEAIWYERPVRYAPILNRLFRQSGYEIGFFAGHDDWRKFNMDGYISAEHFDVFETAKPEGLKSDRRATELASMFLDRSDNATDAARTPRLALLYLYATHATYQSYANDQHFAPAADERFLYPYFPELKPQVWNRYKNSGRTVDRFLGAVMREDRIVVVTGDHGESFLEDETIGHGIRISEFQNMTPAIVYAPKMKPRILQSATSHADLLPTIVSAVGLELTDETALDGLDLLSAENEAINERVFVTRNYLKNDVGLIGPWTDARDPFAYRLSVSLREMKIAPLGAIDRQGFQHPTSEQQLRDCSNRWLESRFGIRIQP